MVVAQVGEQAVHQSEVWWIDPPVHVLLYPWARY